VIVLFGATGYTGRLTAAELAGAGGPFVVAGRSRPKLDILVSELRRSNPDAEVSVRVADVAEPGSLRSMCEGASALVSCVGPFERHGMAVVEAAVDSGVPYCDSTGEPDFMRRVADRFGAAAVPVVPACGFDYVPHDLAAAEAAAGLGSPPEQVDTALLVTHMRPSRGTATSAIGAVTAESVEWDGGRWRPVRIGSQRRRFDFPAPLGSRAGVAYPGGDAVQIVQHCPSARVRSHIVLPAPAAAAASVLMPTARALLAPEVIQGLLGRALERMPEGPADDVRRAATFAVLAEASAGASRATAVATGGDVYGFTARSLTECVTRLSRWDEHGIEPGFKAPSQICGERAPFAKAVGVELRTL